MSGCNLVRNRRSEERDDRKTRTALSLGATRRGRYFKTGGGGVVGDVVELRQRARATPRCHISR